MSTADPTSPAPPTGDALPAKSRRAVDTAPLLAIAAALIVNSHLEGFYPSRVRFLAADGLLGNSMFFLLSGFGLQASDRGVARGFVEFCKRRATRLYPSVFLCVLAFAVVIGGAWRVWRPLDYARQMVWPTQFTYVYCIVPFYVLYYGVMRARRPVLYPALIALLIGPYLYFYLPDARTIPPGTRLSMGLHVGYMHEIAYFQVMLLGGWLATRTTRPRAGTGLYAATIAVLGLYFGIKFLMVARGQFAAYYCVLHALVFALSGLLFLSLTAEPFGRLYRSIPIADWLIGLIAGMTLETYLVHTYLVEYRWLSEIVFPANIIVLAVLTVAIAYSVGLVAKRAQAALGGRSAS